MAAITRLAGFFYDCGDRMRAAVHARGFESGMDLLA